MNNQIEFEIFIIKTLPDKYLNKCKNSLIGTTDGIIRSDCYKVINEMSSREKTLNTILEIRNNNKDLFIVADDIVFLDGWYEGLINNYKNGNIIGFSMIDAQSGLLQDFGYDFVSVDDELSYRGLYKHKELKELDLPEYRICDAVTGCAMFIKKNVLDDVNKFPLEGQNRWGELLFSHLANKYGHETIVLNSHLRHYGISTKQNKDVKKSSMSWLVEKELWSKAVEKYLKCATPARKVSTYIENQLKRKLQNSTKILFYGCGFNADKIISILGINNFSISSGLSEEKGQLFYGERVKDIDLIDFELFDCILITPIGYDEIILSKFSSCKPEMIIGLSIKSSNRKVIYKLRELN